MKRAAPLSLLALASPCLGKIQNNPEILASVKGGIAGWLYDRGIFGSYPAVQYKSFGAESPQVNRVQKDDRCDDGLVFIAPRGSSVNTPGPMILDNDGNLVWMQTSWGQAADLKVQTVGSQSFITFWHDQPSSVGGGGSGQGAYVVLDHSYRLVKEIKPAGGLGGDFHEFKLTQNGTALLTVYNRTKTDIYALGLQHGWVIDSVFQEVNITTGELIFEWRASEYFTIEDTLSSAQKDGAGSSPEQALDFFHINSVDKDADGNYLVSAANMHRVLCISSKDGSLLWQLGGEETSFRELSGGAATSFSRSSDVKWHNDSTITLFDSNDGWKSSRGLMLEVNSTGKTATLLHEYRAPAGIRSRSDGSMQLLPNGNVLVGWGDIPAFTEYSVDGEVLCDTHTAPVAFAKLGWVRSYRTYKFPWVGNPQTRPDVAVRPDEDAVYVSWNGATEVAGWVLDAYDPEQKEDVGAASHAGRKAVEKTGFETRIAFPKDAPESNRVAAVDRNGNILAWSKPVLRNVETTPLYFSQPSDGGERSVEAATVLCGLALVTVLSIGAMLCSRWAAVAWTALARRRKTRPWTRMEYEYRTLGKSDKGLV